MGKDEILKRLVETSQGWATRLDGLPDPLLGPDTEILATCEALVVYSGGRVKVETGDYGMRLRAAARGVECVSMPTNLEIKHAAEGI